MSAQPAQPKRWQPDWWVVGLYSLHSFISLAYEVVWLRLLTAQFGRTLMVMGLVMSIYMAGLGLGAALISTWSRTQPIRPRRVYIIAQVLLGLSGSSLPGLLRWIDQLTMTVAPATKSLAPYSLQLGLCAVYILILATITGIIFPLLSAHRAPVPTKQTGSHLGWLYWAGLIGACLGALIVPLLFIPAFGYVRTALLLGLLSVISALGGCYLLGDHPPPLSTSPRSTTLPTQLSIRRLCFLSSGVGFCFFALQPIAATYLWLIVDATVYAEGILLSATLFCMGAGALVYLELRRFSSSLIGLIAGGFLCMAGAELLWLVGAAEVAKSVDSLLQKSVGLAFPALRFLGIQSILVLMTVGIPTAAAGFVMTALYELSSRYGRNANLIGRLTAYHYGGAILGSAGASFIIIPLLGMTGSLILLSIVATLLTVACVSHTPRFMPHHTLSWAGVIGLCALIVGVGFTADLTFRDQAAGLQHEVAWRYEDGTGIVEVYRERETGYQTLRSSRLRQEGGDRPSDVHVERLQGALPVLLHPNPQHVLHIGLGTGISVSASLRPEVAHLTCVELSPGIVKAATLFNQANGRVLKRKNLTLVHQDGRTYLKHSNDTYDLIIQDLFFPYRSGVGSLYTHEHYQHLKARLTPRGRAVQWIALNQLGQLELQSLIRTFISVFPETSLWLTGGYLMLYGGLDQHRIDWPTWYQRTTDRLPVHDTDPFDLLGMFMATGKPVRQWAASARLNTDDNAFIEFRAPRAFETLNSVKLAVENLAALVPLQQPVVRLFDDLPPTVHRRLTHVSQASGRLWNGIIARATGNLTQARKLYEQAYDLNPVNQQVRQFLQDDLAARGRQARLRQHFDQAEEFLKRAIRLNPALTGAWFDLALIAISGQDYGTAISHLTTLTQIDPAYPNAHFNLGVSLYHIGRYTDAAIHFRYALSETPDSVDTHFNLANSLAQSGRYDEALIHYQQTLTLSPDYHQARENLNAITSWLNRQSKSQSRP